MSASPADLTPEASCWPGTLKANGRLDARGGCSPGGFTGFLQGSGEGLPRGRERRLDLRIVKLALVAPEVDGHLQLMSLLHQPTTLSFEACVYVR